VKAIMIIERLFWGFAMFILLKFIPLVKICSSRPCCGCINRNTTQAYLVKGGGPRFAWWRDLFRKKLTNSLNPSVKPIGLPAPFTREPGRKKRLYRVFEYSVNKKGPLKKRLLFSQRASW